MRHYSKQEILLLKGQLHFCSERVNMYPVTFLIPQIFVLSNLSSIQTLRNYRFKFQMKSRFWSTKVLIDILPILHKKIKLFLKNMHQQHRWLCISGNAYILPSLFWTSYLAIVMTINWTRLSF